MSGFYHLQRGETAAGAVGKTIPGRQIGGGADRLRMFIAARLKPGSDTSRDDADAFHAHQHGGPYGREAVKVCREVGNVCRDYGYR